METSPETDTKGSSVSCAVEETTVCETEMVKLNLRGNVFLIKKHILSAVPDSRLAKLSRDSEEFNEENNEYYFNVNPTMFHEILDFYSTGELHLITKVCPVQTRRILNFWGINDLLVKKCCWRYMYQNDDVDTFDELEKNNILNDYKKNKVCEADVSKLRKSKIHELQSYCRDVLENPFCSCVGKFWYALTMMMAVLSILTFGLMSTKEARERHSPNDVIALNISNPKLAMLYETTPQNTVYVLDLLSNSFLVIDIILRFFCCRRKRGFFINPIHILEIISLSTAFVVVHFEKKPPTNGNMLANTVLVSVINAFFSIRVIIILRLACHADRMKILIVCMKHCIKDLLHLCVTLISGAILFGTLIFCVEFFVDDTFENFFVGVWWAIITMTTVGYGDHFPTSYLGQIVGSVTALVGIMILAMPIAVLSSQFSLYYDCFQIKERVKKRKEFKTDSNNANPVAGTQLTEA